MLKVTLFLTFILSSINLNGQEAKCIFYDFDEIINDLKLKGDRSRYYRKLDLETMMFLDFDSYKVFQKINKNFVQEYHIDTLTRLLYVRLDDVQTFDINVRDIKDFFRNQNIFQLTNRLYFNDGGQSIYKFHKIIYVKGNTKAVYTIYISNLIYKLEAEIMENKITIRLLNEILID